MAQPAVAVRIWNAARPRLDLVAIGALLVALFFFPKALGFPPSFDGDHLKQTANYGGIAALGAVGGSAIALQALGVVLILRSTRVFNFGQVQLGAISALVFYELIHHTQFVLLADMACGNCFRGVPGDPSYLQSHAQQFMDALNRHGYGGWITANFWVSMAVAFLIAPLISWALYMLVIRRFDSAPRLIVTVVTLAVAQVLVAIANYMPASVFQDQRTESTAVPTVIPDHTFLIPPWTAHTADGILAGCVVLVLLLLGAFFLFTSTGVAMRGAADNARRALTLGINVARLSSLSWLFAGALSGLAAILAVLQNGSFAVQQTANFQVGTLVQVLAAVVIARLVSLPLAVAGALVIGIIDQLFFWNFSSSVYFDGALLVIIGGILLLQSARQSRAEQEATASYLAAREARPIPGELRNVSVVDSAVRWFGIAVGVIVLGLPFVLSPAQVSLMSVVLIYTIIGLSLLILTGWAGQISLGQFAFAAVGGYVAAIVAARAGLFMGLDLIVGGIAGAVVAVVVGLPALRLRGLYLAVSTLALAGATSSVLLNSEALGRYLPSTLDRPTVIGFDLNDERVFYYVSLILVILASAAVAGLRRSRTARALIACRDNEQAAQSLGINLFRARLEAFALSGFMAAFAGALFAFHEHGVEPRAFAPEQSVNIFNIIVIGGLGSLLGPLMGSIFNGLFLLFANPIFALLGSGFGVLGVLLMYPGGLSAMAYAVRDSWLRRVAIRYRIVVPSLLADLREDTLETEALIAPKTRPGGGVLFVPERYRLKGQWDKFAEEEPARAG